MIKDKNTCIIFVFGVINNQKNVFLAVIKQQRMKNICPASKNANSSTMRNTARNKSPDSGHKTEDEVKLYTQHFNYASLFSHGNISYYESLIFIFHKSYYSG